MILFTANVVLVDPAAVKFGWLPTATGHCPGLLASLAFWNANLQRIIIETL